MSARSLGACRCLAQDATAARLLQRSVPLRLPALTGLSRLPLLCGVADRCVVLARALGRRSRVGGPVQNPPIPTRRVPEPGASGGEDSALPDLQGGEAAASVGAVSTPCSWSGSPRGPKRAAPGTDPAVLPDQCPSVLGGARLEHGGPCGQHGAGRTGAGAPLPPVHRDPATDRTHGAPQVRTVSRPHPSRGTSGPAQASAGSAVTRGGARWSVPPTTDVGVRLRGRGRGRGRGPGRRRGR